MKLNEGKCKLVNFKEPLKVESNANLVTPVVSQDLLLIIKSNPSWNTNTDKICNTDIGSLYSIRRSLSKF